MLTSRPSPSSPMPSVKVRHCCTATEHDPHCSPCIIRTIIYRSSSTISRKRPPKVSARADGGWRLQPRRGGPSRSQSRAWAQAQLLSGPLQSCFIIPIRADHFENQLTGPTQALVGAPPDRCHANQPVAPLFITQLSRRLGYGSMLASKRGQ
jgi:hypothetical protein